MLFYLSKYLNLLTHFIKPLAPKLGLINHQKPNKIFNVFLILITKVSELKNKHKHLIYKDSSVLKGYNNG